jgi:ATP-dependent DNA helicase RecG
MKTNSKGKYRSVKNNKLQIKSKPKNKNNVNKEELKLKITSLLECLDKGDLVPVRNYLKGLLPREKKYTKTSKLAAEEFRQENLAKQTPAEKQLGKILRELKIKYQAQRPVHYAKGKFFILDFYIVMSRLCIEVDGGYHNTPEQQEKDTLRTEILNKQNVKVVRFTNEEILHNPDIKIIIKQLCDSTHL